MTPEVAAERAVRSGDWVDYGFGGGYPELLDKALAARKGHLKDVKVRGGLVIRPRIEVVEADPEQESFSYYSWHIGDYERKLQTRGLVKFMPVVLRLLPTLYIRTDVAFVPVSAPDENGYCGLGISNFAWRTMFESARTVIFEINEHYPKLQGVDGSHRVHLSEADYIVDIGPGAGKNGGHVVACGTAEDLMKVPESITGAYLSGKKQIPVPTKRRKPTGYLKVKGASENNLKNINVKIPLGVMTCVTGVSGSGKSSLVNEILCKSLTRTLNRARCIPGKHKGIEGVEQLDKVINIDQSPIGRTPRSNPATYTGVFDMIRDLFASTPDAKAKGYKKGRFSFNVKGGRCEACSGDGILKIEMNFLPDIYVPCEVCGGKRYNRETLDVKYKGKSIYDVLEMTVEDALEFFRNIPTIHRKIQTLYDVGLSYVKLGQPSTTLSGGEAQRIKLATELSKRSTGRTIYILDEPTTGLHFADVHKLIEILQRLTEGGNSVVVIEHNLDVIKTADYIIDMGPEGGDRGGTVVTQGTPEQVADCEESYTGYYMKKMLKEN